MRKFSGRDVARDSGAGGLTGIHPIKDGWCELISRPGLARDPRCATMRSRVVYAAELVPELRSGLALPSNGSSCSASACPCASVRPIEATCSHRCQTIPPRRYSSFSASSRNASGTERDAPNATEA